MRATAVLRLCFGASLLAAAAAHGAAAPLPDADSAGVTTRKPGGKVTPRKVQPKSLPASGQSAAAASHGANSAAGKLPSSKPASVAQARARAHATPHRGSQMVQPLRPGEAELGRNKSASHVPLRSASTADTEPAVDPEQAQALREENAAQRQQLKARLDQLRQEISAGEATRSEAADALAASEQGISDTNRKLHDLNHQQQAVQTDLGSLNQKRSAAEHSITAQQLGLAKLLHDRYLSGGEDPFKLLFSGDNPNRIARDFEYLGYLSRAQASMLGDLQKSVAELDDLSHQTTQRVQQLDAIGQEASAERAQLMKDEDAHKATLAAISEKLESQRTEAGNLERDDERLAKVVDELSKLIERQAKERAERARLAQQQRDRDKARLEAQQKAELEAQKNVESRIEAHADQRVEAPPKTQIAIATPPPSAAASTQEESQNGVALADFQGHFPHLKGSLKLPLKGELLSRFGATRSGGGPSWKGLFIQAPGGSEVHAVAPGRVVFAEWLRGFGNLLIIDHGDQYLSVYGNNESLLKQPGDVVQTGDLVATAGNSGGNPETGLYFELRYQGKPFDPLTWTSGH